MIEDGCKWCNGDCYCKPFSYGYGSMEPPEPCGFCESHSVCIMCESIVCDNKLSMDLCPDCIDFVESQEEEEEEE